MLFVTWQTFFACTPQAHLCLMPHELWLSLCVLYLHVWFLPLPVIPCSVLFVLTSNVCSVHPVFNQALWLPGSQTELAVVTADFVKIYDLSQDAISPQYYFLLPSGKIRDATFVFGDECHHLLLMSSSGYIYVEATDQTSHAKHGPFYITNILDVKHADVKVN